MNFRWFNGCGLANLNGINLPSGATGCSSVFIIIIVIIINLISVRYEGILWYFYAKDNRSFRSSRMMIRSN